MAVGGSTLASDFAGVKPPRICIVPRLLPAFSSAEMATVQASEAECGVHMGGCFVILTESFGLASR